MKKTLKIIGIVLLLACVVASCVFYIVLPTETKQFFTSVYDILNRPLPIVGVTTLAVLFFIWKIVFATRYGKKALEKVEQKYQEKYEQLVKQKELVDNSIKESKEIGDKLTNGFINLCDIIPNVKVNKLGESIRKELGYGESIDSETETN